MPNTHQLSLANRTLRTGVTTSLNTGDDGTYKKGIFKSPRFVDNNDGTISDRATGLMWVQDVGKMATGTPGRLTKNQVVTFRGTWGNSTSYSVGDCVSDPQTGARYICFQAHTSRAGATDWASSTYYPTGSNVRDAFDSSFWQSLADHTSMSEPSDFAASTYYNSGDIVRDPASPNHYWQAGFSGYSISAPPDYYAGMGYLNYGDKVRDPLDGKYYTWQNYGYTMSDPGSWSAYNYYNGGDYRYVSGYTGYGLSDGYYYCNSYHYAGTGNFYDDYSSGYWSYTGYPDMFAFDRGVNSGNWSYTGYDTLFSLERSINSWSDIADHLFGLDRYLNSGNWTSTSNTFNMSNDRTDHPTYWELAEFVGNPSSSIPSAFTYTNALSKVEALDYAGYTDWRMPNIEELSSFINYLATSQPFVDTTFFKNIQSNYYYSSTPYAPSTSTNRWGFYIGVRQASALNISSAYPVIPVRGG